MRAPAVGDMRREHDPGQMIPNDPTMLLEKTHKRLRKRQQNGRKTHQRNSRRKVANRKRHGCLLFKPKYYVLVLFFCQVRT